MGTERVAALRPVLPQLFALIEQPLTQAALDAHRKRNRWVRGGRYTLLPDEFEFRVGPGLILRGEIDPGTGAWHAQLVVWDRRWDTSKGAGKRLFCVYDLSHPDFEAAFDRALEAGVAALGPPSGTGSRRPRYTYGWPTRRHAFWEIEDRVLLICQSEDPGAGGRSVLVWLGSRSHLRRNPYLPQRLKGG